MTRKIKASEIVWSIVAYLSVLVFIPLFKKKKTPFIAYHVNQGLVLFLVELFCIVGLTVLGFVMKFAFPAGFFVVRLLLGICLAIFLACHIVGIVHVCCKQARRIPIFGEIRLYELD